MKKQPMSIDERANLNLVGIAQDILESYCTHI